MRRAPIFVGVGIATLCLLAACGKAPDAPSASSAPKVATLKAGTAIPLMLLAPLESGECPKGTLVSLIVAEDVTVDGVVAIPAGTPVGASVDATRAAGALSGMLNEPARLSIELKPIEGAGQSPIVLSGEENGGEPRSYAFTRINTGAVFATAQLNDALQRENEKRALQALAEAIESGVEPDDLQKSIEGNPDLRQAIRTMGYGKASDFMQREVSAEKGVRRLLSTVNDLRDGKLHSANASELQLALAAVEEIGSLANEVQGALKGIFKGRNIRAHVGTRLTVFVAKDVMVTIPAAR